METNYMAYDIEKSAKRIDEILNSLQTSKDRIKEYSSNVDISGLVNQMNADNLIESLENLAKEYNNE